MVWQERVVGGERMREARSSRLGRREKFLVFSPSRFYTPFSGPDYGSAHSASCPAMPRRALLVLCIVALAAIACRAHSKTENRDLDFSRAPIPVTIAVHLVGTRTRLTHSLISAEYSLLFLVFEFCLTLGRLRGRWSARSSPESERPGECSGRDWQLLYPARP